MERDEERRRDAALDRYWDDVVGGGAPAQRADLDQALASVIDRLQRIGLGHAPGVKDAQARVWSSLMSVRSSGESEANAFGHPLLVPPAPQPWNANGHVTALPHGRLQPERPVGWARTALVPLASAALVAVTLVGSLLVVGRLRSQSGTAEPTVVAAIGSPGPGGTAEFVWQTTGDPESPLGDPYHMAIDPDGNLWVADGKNHRFQIFSPDGTFIESWGEPGSGEGQFKFLDADWWTYGFGAIAFDAEGNFYVADIHNHRVQKFGPDRSFIAAWGSEGRADGQFLTPSDIYVDGNGRVFVSDSTREDVQVFDSDGSFLQKWGGNGITKGELLWPNGLGSDGLGNIVVADTDNHRVQVFSADGEPLAMWGGMGRQPGKFLNPDDVALDAAGRIYVTDPHNGRVQAFDRNGTFLFEWGSKGLAEGQFITPVGIVADGEGNVYVSEHGNDRVQKFRVVPAS